MFSRGSVAKERGNHITVSVPVKGKVCVREGMSPPV